MRLDDSTNGENGRSNRGDVTRILFNGNACSIFDGGGIVENEDKEIAISSYSGRNIVSVFTNNASLPPPPSIHPFDIKLSRVQERENCSLDAKCSKRIPYTLQLMRNYCRT